MLLQERCIGCGACLEVCEQGAITQGDGRVSTDAQRCVRCGACVAVCTAEARRMVGRMMTVAQVMAEVERDVTFYDESGGGATFSGGEPLLQPHFLRALLEACREREIHTALDTCGFAPWEVLDGLREVVDLFLYDLKLMDDARHRQFTGVSNATVLSNLRALAERGHDLVLRVPIIPGITDDEENVRQIGAFAAALPLLRRVDVLPYHRAGADKYGRLNRCYDLPEVRPPADERIAQVVRALEALDLHVNVGG